MEASEGLTGLYVREKLVEYTDCLCDVYKTLFLAKDEQILVSLQFDARNNHLIMDQDGKRDLETEPAPRFRLYKSLLLEHAEDCPYFVLKSSPDFGAIQSIKKKNIRLASVVIVMDKNKKNVLLTRRSEGLATFPLAWVYPGGVLDKGESFEEAAVRELTEEVGIKIEILMGSDLQDTVCSYRDEDCVLRPFYLWESVYPARVVDGMPRSHMLVMFYYLVIPHSFEKIPVRIQEAEVDEAVWVEFQTVTEDPDPLGRDMSYAFEESRIIRENTLGKKGFVSHGLVKGIYPNKSGQGLALAHYCATKHLKTLLEKTV